MNRSILSCDWRTLITLALMILAAAGCASPSAEGDSSNATAEEAYIDLKQGFSLVVPIAWQREKIPVSSPDYRPDTVLWQISGPSGTTGSLQIRSQSFSTQPNLQENLTTFLNEQAELTAQETKPFQHPAGSTLRLNGRDSYGNVIYLSIAGPEQTYILAFNIAEADYRQLLPTIEKVILTFLILQD